MSFILEKGTNLDISSFLGTLNFLFGCLLLMCVIIFIVIGLNDKSLKVSFFLFIFGMFVIFIISLWTTKEYEYYAIVEKNGYNSYSVNISKEEYEALKRKQSFKKPELTVEEVESVLEDVNKLFTEETKVSN